MTCPAASPSSQAARNEIDQECDEADLVLRGCQEFPALQNVLPGAMFFSLDPVLHLSALTCIDGVHEGGARFPRGSTRRGGVLVLRCSRSPSRIVSLRHSTSPPRGSFRRQTFSCRTVDVAHFEVDA